jgi:peptide/nickel transport system permease protein
MRTWILGFATDDRKEEPIVTERGDLEQPTAIGTEPPDTGGEGPVLQDPLWRIRLRLARKTFGRNWRMFTLNKIGLIGLGVIVLFAVMGVLQPILMRTLWDPAIYDPVTGYDAPVAEYLIVDEVVDPFNEMDLPTAQLMSNPFVKVGETISIPEQPAPPSRTHLLGTDPLGRDILSQLMYSARAAFAMGGIASVVTVLIATTIGSIAAFYGGWVDGVLMRFADLILLVPLIPVLIVVGALFTLTLPLLGILIGILSGFGGTAIVLKSQALSVTVKPFIDAARVAGGSNRHIILRHIIPNVLPLSFLYMMFTVTEAIALEATLSFLGLMNVQMSWGIMIFTAHSQGYLLSGTAYWWLLFPAGLAVTLLAAAFFLVGRAMDEVINPRLRAR